MCDKVMYLNCFFYFFCQCFFVRSDIYCYYSGISFFEIGYGFGVLISGDDILVVFEGFFGDNLIEVIVGVNNELDGCLGGYCICVL